MFGGLRRLSRFDRAARKAKEAVDKGDAKGYEREWNNLWREATTLTEKDGVRVENLEKRHAPWLRLIMGGKG